MAFRRSRRSRFHSRGRSHGGRVSKRRKILRRYGVSRGGIRL